MATAAPALLMRTTATISDFSGSGACALPDEVSLNGHFDVETLKLLGAVTLRTPPEAKEP
jgi:hypothetical protein